MKVSFSKPGGPESLATAPTPATPVEAQVVPPLPANPTNIPPTGTAAIPPVTQAVAVPPQSAPPSSSNAFGGDDDDDMVPGDLVLPRLNIVQKVGEMSNIFRPGDIVLDAALVIADAGKEMQPSASIRVMVLGLQKTYFAEKLEGGQRGRTFQTEADVVAAGGTLDWNESQRLNKSLYQRVCTGLFLIEKPANVTDEKFPYVIAGKNYALALYTMKGVGYTNAARHIKTAKKIGHLRGVGYRGGFWTLCSKLEKYGQNFAFKPVLKQADATTEAFRNEVQALLGF